MPRQRPDHGISGRAPGERQDLWADAGQLPHSGPPWLRGHGGRLPGGSTSTCAARRPSRRHLLRPATVQDPVLLHRFYSEIRAVSRLTCILNVIDRPGCWRGREHRLAHAEPALLRDGVRARSESGPVGAGSWAHGRAGLRCGPPGRQQRCGGRAQAPVGPTRHQAIQHSALPPWRGRRNCWISGLGVLLCHRVTRPGIMMGFRWSMWPRSRCWRRQLGGHPRRGHLCAGRHAVLVPERVVPRSRDEADIAASPGPAAAWKSAGHSNPSSERSGGPRGHPETACWRSTRRIATPRPRRSARPSCHNLRADLARA